jgi:hypothetical protein
MTTGSLEASDAASAAVQKTPHRVSLDSMKAKIEACEYHNPGLHPSMTVCFMKMNNGFVVVGKSAPADPANFDEKLGMEFAHEDCLRQLWPLEGYALREQLAGTEG